MTTVTQTAREYCRARQEYHQAFRDYFHNQVQPLESERFWQLQPVFAREVYAFRFGYGRTNGVEHAAREFFRKPYANDFTSFDGPDLPKYTLDEAVRFAQSWKHISDQLYRPLFEVVTDRSDDGYGDLLDSLPLAGRDVVDRALKTGGDNGAGFATNAEFEQVVTQACTEQQRPKLAGFILQGENYLGMSLFEAAREYFASQASDNSEVHHAQA